MTVSEKPGEIEVTFCCFWLLGVLSLYFRARIYLGHWPQPSINDPKLLPFEVHHSVFALTLFPLMATILTIPVIWVFQKRILRMPIRNEVLTFVTGWIFIVGAFLLPGVKVVEWFLD